MSFAQKKKKLLLLFLSLTIMVCATWLTFRNTLDNPFVFDDRTVIEGNQLIRNFESIPLFFRGEIDSARRFAGGYRPLVMASLALNYYFSGYDPLPYRLFNLFFHLLNGFLVFFLCRLLFNYWQKKREKDIFPQLFALLVALFFLVNPIQTQTINFIWKRTGILSAFFILCSILNFSLYCRSAKSRYYLLAILTMIVGFFCKENSFIIPLLFISLYAFFKGKEIKRPRALLLLALPLLVAGSFYYYLKYFILSALPPGNQFIFGSLNSFDYFRCQLTVIYRYIFLSLMPYPLSIDYHVAPGLTLGRKLLELCCFVGLLLIFLLTIFLWRKNRLLALAISAFFILLIPTSSFIPLTIPMDEHRLYLPLVFFEITLIFSIYELFKKSFFYRKWPRKGVLALAIFFSLTIVTHAVGASYRNILWQSERLLWQELLKREPENVRAFTNLAYLANMAGEYREARAMALEAIKRNPYYPVPYLNLGLAYNGLDKPIAAIQALKDSLTLRPTYLLGHYNISFVYLRIKNFAKAKEHAQIVLKMAPHHAGAQYVLMKANEGLANNDLQIDFEQLKD